VAGGDDSAPRDANPFLAPGDDHLFYATARITQRLNLLHHLGRYSDQVMVLIGPAGSGKTTLTDRLLREGQNAWRATVVEAQGETTGQELLEHALAGLDARTTVVVTERDAMDALQAHLSAAAKGGLPTLLVVDNAQFLAPPALELLLSLARHPDFPGLRLLLVGEPAIADRVAGVLGEAIYHLVELPPFGREQCMHYITTRLDKSGTPARDLFTSERVDQLWKESGGYPGPLNRLAARVIDAPTRSAAPAAAAPPRPAKRTTTAPPARSARGNRRLLAVIGGSALLLTLAITALLPESTEDRDTGLTRSLPPPAPAERAVPRPPAPSAPRAPAPQASRDAKAPGEATPDPSSSEPPAAAGAQTGAPADDAPGPAVPQPPVEAPTPAPADPAAEPLADLPEAPKESEAAPPPPAPQEQAETRPGAVSEPSPPPPPAVTGTVPPPAARQSQETAAPWPFNLAEDRYVLQLMGSRDEDAVTRLVARHSPGKPTAVVTLVHEGRPWHVLLHGSYASRDEAVGAIRRLAPELRALRPWARSVASLRANLAPNSP